MDELTKYSGISTEDTRDLVFQMIADNLVSGKFDPSQDEFVSAEAASAARVIKSEQQTLAKCIYCGSSLPRGLSVGEEIRCPSCNIVNIG